MACPRCGRARDSTRIWCVECERAYDAWSRRHATDIVWASLSGMVVVLGVAIGMPLLGAPWLAAIAGVFAGFGTLVGVYRWKGQRRRQQFLLGAGIPRAYLTEKP
jgi:hypothetical protein